MKYTTRGYTAAINKNTMTAKQKYVFGIVAYSVCALFAAAGINAALTDGWMAAGITSFASITLATLITFILRNHENN